MVASVAVLSDIHGVLPALDAVLAEPAVRAAERIVLTGDIAAGPQPVQVLDRLLGLGDRVTWVRGNADRELVELARGRPEAADIPDPIAPWAARQLSPDHVDWLARLPYPVTLAVDGFGDVVFCHATPRDDDEVVVVDSRLDRWAEVALGETLPWHARPRECKPLPVQQSGDNRTPGPPLAHYASVAHVARVYDYLLGGKDNFAADREAAEQAMLINPAVVPTARANRAFLARAGRARRATVRR
jgi:predicted phosphodiesterase